MHKTVLLYMENNTHHTESISIAHLLMNYTNCKASPKCLRTIDHMTTNYLNVSPHNHLNIIASHLIMNAHILTHLTHSPTHSVSSTLYHMHTNTPVAGRLVAFMPIRCTWFVRTNPLYMNTRSCWEGKYNQPAYVFFCARVCFFLSILIRLLYQMCVECLVGCLLVVFCETSLYMAC